MGGRPGAFARARSFPPRAIEEIGAQVLAMKRELRKLRGRPRKRRKARAKE